MDIQRVKKSAWILAICLSLIASMYTTNQYEKLSQETKETEQIHEPKVLLDVDYLERSYQKAKKIIRILKL